MIARRLILPRTPPSLKCNLLRTRSTNHESRATSHEHAPNPPTKQAQSTPNPLRAKLSFLRRQESSFQHLRFEFGICFGFGYPYLGFPDCPGYDFGFALRYRSQKFLAVTLVDYAGVKNNHNTRIALMPNQSAEALLELYYR